MHEIIFKIVLSYTSLLWVLCGIQPSGEKDETNLLLASDSISVQHLFDTANNNIESYDIALRFAEESLYTSTKIDCKRGAAQSRFLNGNIYYENCREPIEYYATSLEMYQEIGDFRGENDLLDYIGVSFYTKTAIRHFEHGLSISDSLIHESSKASSNNKFGILTCQNNMGDINVDFEDYTESIEDTEKSVTIERELRNKYGISICLNNIWDCYLKLNKNKMALGYLTKALKIAEEIDNKMVISASLYNLGLIAKGNNVFIKDIQYDERSFKTAKISGNISNFINACELRSNTRSGTKQFEKAYTILKINNKLGDSILTDKKNKQILAITNKYETEKKQLKIIASKEEAKHRDKDKKILLTIIVSGSILVISFLFYIFYIRETKELLKNQKRYFEALITFSENNILVIDENAKIKYISPSFEKKLGRDKEERVGASSFEHIHLHDVGITQKALKTILKSKQPVSVELRVKNISGKWIDMALIANNLLDEPFVNGIVINIWDVTERKKTEKLRIKSEEKYRNIFNAFYDVYYQLTMDGVIKELTPSIVQIGYTREELIGTNIENLYPKDMGQALLYKKLASEKQVTDYDIVILTKDKRKLNCAVTAKVLYDENGKALMIEGIIRDISRRVKVHKALEQSKKRLAEVNKVNKKILSIISHDLLGPIGINKEMTDLIIMEADQLGKDNIIELVARLKPVLDSTYTMAENILSWAEIRKQKTIGTPEPTYLKPIIDECFSLYSVHAHAKSIVLSRKGKEDVTALIDENQIAIVIRNLISNAVKFTNKGGNVIVAMKEGNGFTEVTVSDTGIGMSKEQLSGIFNDTLNKKTRYGTNNEKGTGLGLVIVKEFIKLNNGTIKVESKEGMGTTFKVILPKAK